MKLGSNLRRQRERYGYSQQVVADYLGMTQSNYHNLESDKANVKLDHLEKLATFYNIPIADLLPFEKNTLHIQNNHHGVVDSNAELFQLCLKAKEEIIKLKDQRIDSLEKEIALLTKK